MDYPIIYDDIIQGSEDWHAIRLCKITASNFKTAMSKGVGRGKLQDALVEEYLTQKRKESFCSDNMLRGIEREEEARLHYEVVEGCKVEQVGFVQVSEYIGASPDGLIVGEKRGLEIKCTIPSTHRRYMEANKQVTDYDPQCYGNMWAMGYKSWDFVSYCPECVLIPYWRIRIERDWAKIAEVEVKINKFANELKARIDKLTVPKF
jgi:hypothetical protein